MTASPKVSPIRDPAYIKWLRQQRCLITGQYGHEYETVDPCHIGRTGLQIKEGDNCCLPLLHRFHEQSHSSKEGEIKTLIQMLPNDVLKEALKLYAHYRIYLPWKYEDE